MTKAMTIYRNWTIAGAALLLAILALVGCASEERNQPMDSTAPPIAESTIEEEPAGPGTLPEAGVPLPDGLSEETRACIAALLAEDPALARALSQPEGAPVPLELLACLTPEEAEALTPAGEGPAPDPAAISCLMDQLAGSEAGERIIAVLSGADSSGEGLTMEESTLLGQAVAACGIETEFGF